MPGPPGPLGTGSSRTQPHHGQGNTCRFQHTPASPCAQPGPRSPPGLASLAKCPPRPSSVSV